jgi:hypothetical protein
MFKYRQFPDILSLGGLNGLFGMVPKRPFHRATHCPFGASEQETKDENA